MRRLVFLLTLAPTIALADAYACKKGTEKIISDQPCETMKATTTRQINGSSASSQPYTPDLNAQLENVKRNRQALAASQPVQQATQEPKIDKTQLCEDNWNAMRSINASARQNSTQWHRDEKKRLQDARWNLGC